MPIPTSITDLSQTAADNYPAGSESPNVLDGVDRAHASFIAVLRDGKGFSDPVQLASGATTDIGGQNSMFVEITGTTTITSFSTNYNGPRFLRFTGALILTHNATALNLPGAANITTAAGDTAIAIPNQAGSGWNVVQFMSAADSGQLASSAEVQAGTSTTKSVTPASLRGGALVLGTATASTSGTAINYTSIPSWVKRITVMFSGVSTSGTDNPIIQIGDSGGIEAAGYLGSATSGANAASPGVATISSGFNVSSGAAANVLHGSLVLTLLDSATNTWVANGQFGTSNAAAYVLVAGSKALSATLDRVRITTVGGTDTFDAGLINVLYE